MTTLDEFMTVLTGDSVENAVRETRCLLAPVGCGAPVFNADGSLRHSDPDDDPEQYVMEWWLTGLCADCQDQREELEDARVDRSDWATNAYAVFLDLWEEMHDRTRAILDGEAGDK
ncbi:hypothetical protein [Streptomyces griseoflavus]|uniref:hypothetical protein n=1 Tax=Streptomyces griseoflavus TaxID=35619 RepID=UPI0001B4DBF5|nr:hypothetical protein [Streptomyces griseoflavus]